jgi:hypothetical protein
MGYGAEGEDQEVEGCRSGVCNGNCKERLVEVAILDEDLI